MKNNWSGKRVLVIGAARQGLALVRYLARRDAQVTLNDQNPAERLVNTAQALNGLPVRTVFGAHPLELLEGCDLVCVSGGVPLELPILLEAQKRGIPLTNDSQIFMEEVPCPVIAITGSAGKTTTTTLVGRIAAAGVKAPRRAWVGGNIGTPLIDQVDNIHAEDVVILELSSFQLELMTRSPHIGALLNITPNHLDRHGTMQAYTAAKARILDFQSEADIAVLGRDDPGSWDLRSRVKGSLVTFGSQRPAGGLAGTFSEGNRFWFSDGVSQQPLFEESVVGLRGDHNRLNALAACAIGLAAGFSVDDLRAGVDSFAGVPHRLELVRELNGARWYNDSIATAPERSMAAVRSFTEPIVLMLGGRDKNLPWENLAALIHDRVEHVVLFGEAAGLIAQAIGPIIAGRKPQTLQVCGPMADAVQAAAQVTRPGSVVLFSPGGTSYDEFKDFEERGEHFRQWVKTLS